MNRLIAAVAVCAAFLLFASIAKDIAEISKISENIKDDGEKL